MKSFLAVIALAFSALLLPLQSFAIDRDCDRDAANDGSKKFGIIQFLNGDTSWDNKKNICTCVWKNSLDGCNENPLCNPDTLYSTMTNAFFDTSSPPNSIQFLCAFGKDPAGCTRSMLFFTSQPYSGYQDDVIQREAPGKSLSNQTCPQM
jgi:hypothetical protein